MADDIEKYYQDQLSLIRNPRIGYAAKIKITHDSGETQWLSLNDESATEVVKWLKKNYNIKK